MLAEGPYLSRGWDIEDRESEYAISLILISSGVTRIIGPIASKASLSDHLE